ncbi:MAG: hypothetical protein ACKVWR_09705 [Acidimicrobiales bacterium]
MFDPQSGTPGDTLNAGGSATGEAPPGEVVGSADGPTRDGAALVPLAKALPSYEARATEALDRGDIPPSQQAVVRGYFDRLASR